ncbi:MAG: hypothetical protein KDB28_08735 [Tetrasphaera sp.]|nr:hypothetical protein [Tetrasphaera sp.]HRW03218.1 hypothetical protein [Tetrasphaera sp.]
MARQLREQVGHLTGMRLGVELLDRVLQQCRAPQVLPREVRRFRGSHRGSGPSHLIGRQA